MAQSKKKMIDDTIESFLIIKQKTIELINALKKYGFNFTAVDLNHVKYDTKQLEKDFYILEYDLQDYFMDAEDRTKKKGD